MAVGMDKGQDGYGNATLFPVEQAGSTLIKVLTLDSLELERCNFMKIDVEGMELEVLRGAEQTLARLSPVVVFETLTTVAGEVHKQCEELLASHGYRLFCVDVDDNCLYQVCYPNYPLEDTLALPAHIFTELSKEDSPIKILQAPLC